MSLPSPDTFLSVSGEPDTQIDLYVKGVETNSTAYFGTYPVGGTDTLEAMERGKHPEEWTFVSPSPSVILVVGGSMVTPSTGVRTEVHPDPRHTGGQRYGEGAPQ